jgi:O-acetyl-ADP-ribose deacetylase (regulator of RNase III)
MIHESKGNLLRADAEALVNTVNCVGYMGKGIALQFKQAFPDNFREYEKACRLGNMKPGKVFVFETGMMMNPKYIINFPTKRHWRGNSRIEDIKDGLTSLVDEINRLKIKSIAIPPLGCGNGGLDWKIVKPLVQNVLDDIADIDVFLFAPHGAPDAQTMPIGTARPNMTSARALFVKLMEQYKGMSYRLTLLEIQKLAYFLQESGEPLRLTYEHAPYGPYAANLNKVLERIEGHFIRGYGDSQKPDEEINLLPGAVSEAEIFLEDESESRKRLGRVSELIEGFETPYGMELLSTVHWVAKYSIPRATDAMSAVTAVHDWSERKRKMFKTNHIEIAWQRLSELGWVNSIQ